MKFKSLFYDSSINLKSISKVKLVFGVILGIASSLIIYSFFYLLVEAFRYIDAGFEGELVVLSEKNRNYYSLFFSTLSVVFGNSIAFNYLFSKPQKITHRYNSKRKRLLNDNIFLNFNFSYWFAKIGVSFGVFGMCCFGTQFLPYFKEFSFLLIVVLYLEALKSFSFFLRNYQRLKFIVLHVIFLSIVSFGISKIEVINYKRLDKVMVEKNPIMELPYSSFYANNNYRYPTIRVKLKVDSLGVPYIYSNYLKYSFSDVPSFISTELQSFREELKPFTTISIEANNECNIYYVKYLEQLFASLGIRRVAYVVKTDETVFGKFEKKVIEKKIGLEILKIKDTISSLPPLPPIYDVDYSNYGIKDFIYISVGKNILINNNLVKKDKLTQKIIEHYSKNTLFVYQHNSETKYQEFIYVFASHIEAVEKLRRVKQSIFEDSQYFHSNEYYEEQNKLKNEIPLKFMEEFN